MDKKQMRSQMLKKRNLLSKDDILKKSEIIHQKLKSVNIFQKAKNIMFFASFASEVHTYDMIKESLEEGKKILLPYIDVDENDEKNSKMSISQFDSFNQLEKGYKGINEVKKEYRKSFDKKLINVIVTPCVCYDLQKYRIGYGKGFYDKFFKDTLDAFKIGICFEEMIVEEIERNETDIKVDMVITDKRLII